MASEIDPLAGEIDPLEHVPATQHVASDLVLLEMAELGAKRAVSLSTVQVAVLSVMAGAFIGVGALFAHR